MHDECTYERVSLPSPRHTQRFSFRQYVTGKSPGYVDGCALSHNSVLYFQKQKRE